MWTNGESVLVGTFSLSERTIETRFPKKELFCLGAGAVAVTVTEPVTVPPTPPPSLPCGVWAVVGTHAGWRSPLSTSCLETTKYQPDRGKGRCKRVALVACVWQGQGNQGSRNQTPLAFSCSDVMQRECAGMLQLFFYSYCQANRCGSSVRASPPPSPYML